MKKIIIIMMLILLIFTGCRSRAEPRILLDTDSLTISQEGGRIAIYSHTDGKEYNFRITRKHATETPSEGYTAVESDNIKIVVKPKKIILYVKRSEEIYTISISRIFPNISLKLGVNE